ncbi:MAG: efflux RND transporter periplasmic adaptor subunit [Planctomycetota bacterium]
MQKLHPRKLIKLVRFAVFTGLMWSTCNSLLHAQVTRSFTEPFQIREVAASEAGAIAIAFVEQGQAVEAGQALAELQCDDLKQKKTLYELRADSKHAINSAQAIMQIHKRKKETLEPMLKSGHANQAEVEKAKMDFAAAEAEWQAAKQASEENRIEVKLIQAEIEKRTVRSPISGVVTEVHCKAGEFLSSAEPKFATVAELKRLRVRFYLLASEVAELRNGQEVHVAVGESQEAVSAQVDFVSPITDPDSGTTRVEVVFENSSLRHRSGSPCTWLGQTGRLNK